VRWQQQATIHLSLCMLGLHAVPHAGRRWDVPAWYHPKLQRDLASSHATPQKCPGQQPCGAPCMELQQACSCTDTAALLLGMCPILPHAHGSEHCTVIRPNIVTPHSVRTHRSMWQRFRSQKSGLCLHWMYRKMNVIGHNFLSACYNALEHAAGNARKLTNGLNDSHVPVLVGGPHTCKDDNQARSRASRGP
jgi:hypothetical protein